MNKNNDNKEIKGIENEHRNDNYKNIDEKQKPTEHHLEEQSDISRSSNNPAHLRGI